MCLPVAVTSVSEENVAACAAQDLIQASQGVTQRLRVLFAKLAPYGSAHRVVTKRIGRTGPHLTHSFEIACCFEVLCAIAAILWQLLH